MPTIKQNSSDTDVTLPTRNDSAGECGSMDDAEARGTSSVPGGPQSDPYGTSESSAQVFTYTILTTVIGHGSGTGVFVFSCQG